MTCERCQFIEDEYVKVEAEGLTRDALMLAVAALRVQVDWQTDWYQQRFNALGAWVNGEVRPLSQNVAARYFSIVANGSPAPHERADWRETMHGLTLRAEQAEQHVQGYAADLAEERGVSARWRMRAEDMHRVIVDFCESVTAAEHHWEGPRGGQHVPYMGDWACAVPSVRQRLKWWARHLRDAAKEGQA